MQVLHLVQGTVSHNCTDGDIRLVGGSTSYEGRVEFCFNSVWGTICYGNSRYSYRSYRDYWGQNEGMVVCRQLGHQELGRFLCIDKCSLLNVYQLITDIFLFWLLST